MTDMDHDALLLQMRTIRRVDGVWYMDEFRITNPDPCIMTPETWTVSSRPSPKALLQTNARTEAYWPIEYPSALAYIRARHCIGIQFEDERIGLGGPFPFGWVWINLKDDAPNSWAVKHAVTSSMRAHERNGILGPNVRQEGAKLHSSCGIGVPYGAADTIILPRWYIEQLARDLNAYRAWRGGDDTDGKGLDDKGNDP